MSFLIASTYFTSSVAGFVSSKRKLHVPPNSLAMPKLAVIAFTCPMCGNPFGSGGKRVLIGRPNRSLATSSATISRRKSRFTGAGTGESAGGLDTGDDEFREDERALKDITTARVF